MTDHSGYCFGAFSGENNRGQLGLGNTNDRGDAANEMGNDLPVADLGDNADGSKIVVKDVSGGWEHTCALSTIGEIKWYSFPISVHSSF